MLTREQRRAAHAKARKLRPSLPVKITLSANVRQDPREPNDAPAYLVFSVGGEPWTFPEIDEARGFAAMQLDESDETSWPVYPLWAGPPIESGE